MGRKVIKRGAQRRAQGQSHGITSEFKDAVTTRAMQLRLDSYTLRETVEIVNEEFNDTLAFETVRRWIQERIKPELEETADAYRQNLLEQISVQKRRLERKLAMGDEKAMSAWTRLIDREMRLTGVEKPIKVSMTTANLDTDGVEVQKMLDQFFGRDVSSGEGHVIQGEVVRREEG
jgi:hypothetical protein